MVSGDLMPNRSLLIKDSNEFKASNNMKVQMLPKYFEYLAAILQAWELVILKSILKFLEVNCLLLLSLY